MARAIAPPTADGEPQNDRLQTQTTPCRFSDVDKIEKEKMAAKILNVCAIYIYKYILGGNSKFLEDMYKFRMSGGNDGTCRYLQ
ncbi:hypothetical protein GDO81_012540 [Engystomops pustulosus]|uniref:Uncharacterized protein n=1 Tax=Engystomops pustulosus TaxID=76066 RepID=A0AAV7BMN5_ENGPU|nr:hypothetical protein GDO81_012540 [Engystomops pustulosus]